MSRQHRYHRLEQLSKFCLILGLLQPWENRQNPKQGASGVTMVLKDVLALGEGISPAGQAQVVLRKLLSNFLCRFSLRINNHIEEAFGSQQPSFPVPLFASRVNSLSTFFPSSASLLALWFVGGLEARFGTS